jgi:tetratricopeptide (TPR) repeat protein
MFALSALNRGYVSSAKHIVSHSRTGISKSARVAVKKEFVFRKCLGAPRGFFGSAHLLSISYTDAMLNVMPKHAWSTVKNSDLDFSLQKKPVKSSTRNELYDGMETAMSNADYAGAFEMYQNATPDLKINRVHAMALRSLRLRKLAKQAELICEELVANFHELPLADLELLVSSISTSYALLKRHEKIVKLMVLLRSRGFQPPPALYVNAIKTRKGTEPTETMIIIRQYVEEFPDLLNNDRFQAAATTDMPTPLLLEFWKYLVEQNAQIGPHSSTAFIKGFSANRTFPVEFVEQIHQRMLAQNLELEPQAMSHILVGLHNRAQYKDALDWFKKLERSPDWGHERALVYFLVITTYARVHEMSNAIRIFDKALAYDTPTGLIVRAALDIRKARVVRHVLSHINKGTIDLNKINFDVTLSTIARSAIYLGQLDLALRVFQRFAAESAKEIFNSSSDYPELALRINSTLIQLAERVTWDGVPEWEAGLKEATNKALASPKPVGRAEGLKTAETTLPLVIKLLSLVNSLKLTFNSIHDDYRRGVSRTKGQTIHNRTQSANATLNPTPNSTTTIINETQQL